MEITMIAGVPYLKCKDRFDKKYCIKLNSIHGFEGTTQYNETIIHYGNTSAEVLVTVPDFENLCIAYEAQLNAEAGGNLLRV